MPTFVKYIEDNDIGRWKYKNTLPFISTLQVNFKLEPTFKNLKKWDKLLNENILNSYIKKGKLYMEYKNYLLNFQLLSLHWH